MLKGRLYLAITAYVLLIKRYVNKTFDRVFGLCYRANQLFRLLRKATSSSANTVNQSAIGKVKIPLHTHSTLGTSKGFQIRVLLI
ncbi:hypothetical protein [uncultured Acetobacteroides sp.]|uniref:hypothetical protein n=1 Tax=uncultured Acetobacteroides sp. TaxID=1760811 RepID=UPI0029F46350|nr:hypothetical protein [uncultured Acetobacteroides sp.]